MNIYVIAFLVAVPSLALLILIAWAFSFYFHRRFYRAITFAGNSVRSFVIDVMHEQVRYFDRNNIHKLRTMTLRSFVGQFSASDRKKISAWMNSAFRKKTFDDIYLPTHVQIDRIHHLAFSVLKMVKINKGEQILHIDSYLFRFLNRKNRSGYYMGETALPEINNALKLNRYHRGAAINFVFTLVSKNNVRTPLNYLLSQQLKEIVLMCANSPLRYLYGNNDSAFTIMDFKSKNKVIVEQLVSRMIGTINRFLELNGLLDRVLMHVGIVHISDYPYKADKLIAMAQEMSNTAIQKNVQIVTYSKALLDAKATAHRSSEIEQILRSKKICYGFQSVYDVKKERVIGFLTNSWLKDSDVKIIDIYNRSPSEDDQKKLVNMMTRDVITHYHHVSDDDNKILFMNSKFMDTISFMRCLGNKVTCRVAPCFDEYDVDYYLKTHQDFFEIIRALKFRGFLPCLKLADKAIVLDQKVYAEFSYFIVNLTVDREDNKKRGNSPALMDYRTIVEKLLRYNKPIIVAQADTWSLAEMVIRTGINYLAGQAVAPVNEGIIVPTPKNIIKMRKMLE